MRNWPCDLCAGPIVSFGESIITCPKAHRHRVCVDCQKLMYDGFYGHAPGTKTIDGVVKGRHGHGWLKQRRCPKEISDADRVMWALADDGTTTDGSEWETTSTDPI